MCDKAQVMLNQNIPRLDIAGGGLLKVFFFLGRREWARERSGAVQLQGQINQLA
jgi:hypothetical protein